MASSDQYNRFTASVASQLIAPGDGGSRPVDDEMKKTLRELTASFALTNQILASTYGNGVVDRRSGQSYFIDVGLSLPDVNGATGTEAIDARILVNTSRISELVSPSMGTSDVKFNIGVDSFSIHRYRAPATAADALKVFPIYVACDKLQQDSGSRYLAVLSGESGSALSATAQSVFHGELPSSLEFRFGFMSPIPVDSNGILSRKLFPLSFEGDWKDTGEGLTAPRVIGTDELLWGTSNIYALSLRLYVIPTITPRFLVRSQ